MARRHASVSDSLDLLLDTICNTFGGILFIALLVVILLQLHGEDATVAATVHVTPQEVERLQADLTGRLDDLRRLRELLDSQERTLASLAPPETAPMVASHSNAIEKNAELTQNRERLLGDVAALTTSLLRADEELRQADKDLRESQQKVAELQQQLEADRASRRRELRTPVQRISNASSEVGCVIQYGRFYVWHHYDQFEFRSGLNTDDFLILDDSSDGVYTAPRPTAGIPLDGSERSQKQLLARLSSFRPSSVHVAVIVRPDSFAEWPQARDALIAQGFEYRLMPTETPVVDRGGSHSRVQ